MSGTATATRVALSEYRPDRSDVRVLFELAGPVVLVQIGLMSMGAIDTMPCSGANHASNSASKRLSSAWCLTHVALNRSLRVSRSAKACPPSRVMALKASSTSEAPILNPLWRSAAMKRCKRRCARSFISGFLGCSQQAFQDIRKTKWP